MDRPTDGSPDQRAPLGRRPRTRAEERIAALDAPPSTAELLARADGLEQELAAARQEAEEHRAAWQRAAADFANFKRRTEQEREASLGLANEVLLLKVVTLADDFDRALASAPAELAGSSWLEGLEAIDRKFRQLLESEGVTPIEAQGRPFDPREHEAVAHEATTDVPDDTVISELQRGYRIRDRVLRPSLVSVAKNPGH
ncbi:MAG TPA: nucleotide exchange factor GrpE [Candidatus Limnocylindrales bacterium]|nr:nucleotide exchange factor GrpE [Candidatus Limnocylindrales bacterium]